MMLAGLEQPQGGMALDRGTTSGWRASAMLLLGISAAAAIAGVVPAQGAGLDLPISCIFGRHLVHTLAGQQSSCGFMLCCLRLAAMSFVAFTAKSSSH